MKFVGFLNNGPFINFVTGTDSSPIWNFLFKGSSVEAPPLWGGVLWIWGYLHRNVPQIFLISSLEFCRWFKDKSKVFNGYIWVIIRVKWRNVCLSGPLTGSLVLVFFNATVIWLTSPFAMFYNPCARHAGVQDVMAKCVNVVRVSHVCEFAWCWTEAVSMEWKYNKQLFQRFIIFLNKTNKLNKVLNAEQDKL